jgi:hypothetical protein
LSRLKHGGGIGGGDQLRAAIVNVADVDGGTGESASGTVESAKLTAALVLLACGVVATASTIC